MSTGLDLSALVSLRSRDAGSSSVWLLQLPKAPWKHAAAALERKAIVDKLTVAFPYRSLWMSDWVTSKEPRWQRLAATDDLYSSEGLDHGGWALLFFDSEQTLPPRHLDQLAIDATAAKQLLGEFSARAAIMSLVDDDDWLVAVSE